MSDPFANFPDDVHPFKNFTPRKNPPKQSPPNSVSPNSVVPIDVNDIEAVKAMVWEKLVTIAHTMPACDKALPILREIMDRIDGKPVQKVKQDTTITYDLKANEALLNRFKDRIGGKDPIVIDQSTSGTNDANQ